MTTGHDYEVGQQIATLIGREGGGSFSPAPLIGQVQDLLGQDTTLLGPLRDLLQRPGFRRLFADGQRSVQISGRDALLQDLASLYHPAVVNRLAAVLDGCLGLPSTAPGPPPAPQTPANSAQSRWEPPRYEPRSAPQSRPTHVPAEAAYGATPPPSYPPTSPYPAPAGGINPITLVLTVVASFLAGAVLLSLGWLLFHPRSTPPPRGVDGSKSSGTSPSPSPPVPSPLTASPSPEPSTPPKTISVSATPETAWGSAADYKFGRLPEGDYPHSCAFTKTTADGKLISDKTTLEYWACRDEGGTAKTGYTVVWADGKPTTYTFEANGEGEVVGTDGKTAPMRWSNDSHKGDNIVIINHKDGAISWIPGNITPTAD
ncbi:MAG: hypothetical protein ACK55X_06005 [Synechococcaceae cyanobacterium]